MLHFVSIFRRRRRLLVRNPKKKLFAWIMKLNFLYFHSVMNSNDVLKLLVVNYINSRFALKLN